IGAQPDTTPRTVQIVARLGQPVFGRQTPDGWPDRADAWMNTGAILNRINFGLNLAAGQVPGARLASWAPATRLAALPLDAQVNGVIDELVGGDVSDVTREILLTGRNPATNEVGMQPVVRAGPPVNGLANIVGLALGSPEFQRK